MSSMTLEKQTSFLRPKLTGLLIFLSLVIFATSTPASAQNNKPNHDQANKNDQLNDDQKLLRDLRNQLLGDRKALEQYFQKDFLDRMDKMFEDSMKQFGGDDFDEMFKAFKDGFNQGLGSGLNNRWLKEKQGMVLLIDGAVAQGGNFDLKVKEGQVTIKGSLEKDLGQMGKRMMSFNNSFPVPRGTDPNKVRIENGDDGLRVVFPWKDGEKMEKSSDFPSKKDIKKKIKIKQNSVPDKVPLKKDSDDLVI